MKSPPSQAASSLSAGRFDPREAIPVELEHDNRLFVVHIDRVLAILKKASTVKEKPNE
jgi:hypothetical protein